MPRSTTAALRDAGPAAPRERAALLLGGATAVMGALMLLLAVAAVLWAVGMSPGSASHGHFGGIAFAAWFMLVAGLAPGVVVLCTLAVFYARAGLRAHEAGVRTFGLWLAGWTSLALAVVTAIVALAVEAGWLGRSIEALLGVWRELAIAAFVVLGAHGVATTALGRPGAITRRRAVAWLLGGAVVVAIGTALIVRGGADQWLDGPPLPGLADSVSGFWGRPDALALSHDGTRLAAAQGSRFTFFDVDADRELWTTHVRAFAQEGADPPHLIVSPDGSKVLVAARAGFAVLDAARGDVVLRPACGPGQSPSGSEPTRSGAFAREGTVLVLSATASQSDQESAVCFLDATSGAQLAVIARSCDQLTATAKGDRVWGSCGGAPTALDPATGAELLAIDTVAHEFAVFPDGTRIITTPSMHSGPRWIRVFDADTGAKSLEFSIEQFSSAVVGPLRGGEAWLIAEGTALIEVDLAERRVTRTLCGDFWAAATAAGRLVTRSRDCHPNDESLWVRDASR
ncbi:hypothetical protein [Nannocystis radixulma]|uniref:WD40 repeat domain-containing protein n=1 Tax=Nannocystis radixulma TaxID=2995305 RepID=A0ABT5BN99_9BACT|nr:hypothetical protein [Nannocystis radixulma]MDC0674467.1 hypothetical protein [Nannocystis radixulma]